jgi:UDP-N-acetylmuramoyl-tripeptide--D-alanyl-D-alanine ligase
VTTDSRQIEPGGVFVALPGERVDGADFVGEVFEKGALAAIVSEAGAQKVSRTVSRTRPVFVVRDPVEALGDMARAHRLRHRAIPLVGITGSSGKTTTKELLHCLLSRTRSPANPGTGTPDRVPLAAVLPGNTTRRSWRWAPTRPANRAAGRHRPDIAVITNVAPAHLEGFRTMEGVAREKGDLFRALGDAGTAVVNATDLRVVREAGRCRAEKVHYGVALNDFSGRIVSMSDAGMRIAVRTPAGEFSSFVGIAGEHHR